MLAAYGAIDLVVETTHSSLVECLKSQPRFAGRLIRPVQPRPCSLCEEREHPGRGDVARDNVLGSSEAVDADGGAVRAQLSGAIGGVERRDGLVGPGGIQRNGYVRAPLAALIVDGQGLGQPWRGVRE
jgi:hypothetical protein